MRQRDRLGPTGRALVAGCGRGHDAYFLASIGFSVLAIDCVPEAAAFARERLQGLKAEVRCMDAFELDEGPSFDLVLEHTFLCALPLERRPDWADLMRRHLRPGGRLVALVFPVGKPASDGGPPFGLTTDQIADLLAGDFELVHEEVAHSESPARGSGERFAVFQRRD